MVRRIFRLHDDLGVQIIAICIYIFFDKFKQYLVFAYTVGTSVIMIVVCFTSSMVSVHRNERQIFEL